MRFIATYLCLMLAISAGSASADWNLCVGDDGHATFELAHTESDCWTEELRHHPERAASGMRGPLHHGCRDVPLVEIASGHVSSQRLAICAPAAVDWRPAIAPAPRGIQQAPAGALDAHDETLVRRQRVVLIL